MMFNFKLEMKYEKITSRMVRYKPENIVNNLSNKYYYLFFFIHDFPESSDYSA